jgi:hypothetical protein
VYRLVHKHHHRQHAPSRGNTDAVNVHPFEFVVGEYLHLAAVLLVGTALRQLHRPWISFEQWWAIEGAAGTGAARTASGERILLPHAYCVGKTGEDAACANGLAADALPHADDGEVRPPCLAGGAPGPIRRGDDARRRAEVDLERPQVPVVDADGARARRARDGELRLADDLDERLHAEAPARRNECCERTRAERAPQHTQCNFAATR